MSIEISLPCTLCYINCKEYVYNYEVHTLLIVFISHVILNVLGNPCSYIYGTEL